MSDNESLTPIERTTPQRITGFNPPTLEVEPQGPENHLSLATFWQIIVKRMATVIATAVTVLVLTAIYTYRMHRVYQAVATIEIETDYPQLQSVNELYRRAPIDDTSFLTTQEQILKSDNLAWQTIEEIGLDRGPAAPVPGPGPNASASHLAQVKKSSMIAQFKSGLSIDPLKESRILAVKFESEDPDIAALIANKLIDNYREFNFNERNKFTSRASKGMQDQLDDLRAKVEKSQQELIDYERQNLIINTGGDKPSINDQRLEQLATEFTSAQTDRDQKQSLYEMAKANEGEVGTLVQNQMLQRLEEKYSDQKGAYSDALSQYGPNFPKVVHLREQLTTTQGLMEQARKQAIQKIRNEYLAAVTRENLLQEALAREKANVSALSQKMIEHNILRRNFEANQQLYDNLLQRLKDATLSASLQATNVHVIDQAVAPTVPIRPNRRGNMISGLLVGLILGLTLAFLQEALDSSVRTTEEAERLTSAPTLAVIPVDGNNLKRRRRHGHRPLSPATASGVGLTVLKRPSSSMAESFRSLRTSVLLSTAPRPPQSLLVTSAQVGEGKTSTASNLAMSFAQRGGGVLLIDADLRRPAVARTLGISNERGLSSYLTGAHTLDEVLIHYDRFPNLWIMPAGPRPPDPAELLSSQMMEATLKDLMPRFSQIIIDSPPLLLVTDAVILSAVVDGVILVVASGATGRGALSRAHRVLDNAGARLLGLVLNKVDMRFDSYYGSYYGPYYQAYYDEVSVSNPQHSPASAGRPKPKDSSPGA